MILSKENLEFERYKINSQEIGIGFYESIAIGLNLINSLIIGISIL
jgi:hypothetical protein